MQAFRVVFTCHQTIQRTKTSRTTTNIIHKPKSPTTSFDHRIENQSTISKIEASLFTPRLGQALNLAYVQLDVVLRHGGNEDQNCSRLHYKEAKALPKMLI